MDCRPLAIRAARMLIAVSGASITTAAGSVSVEPQTFYNGIRPSLGPSLADVCAERAKGLAAE
jgi:hypothetical protein